MEKTELVWTSRNGEDLRQHECLNMSEPQCKYKISFKDPDGKRFIEWRTNKKLNWFQRKMIKVFFGLDYERVE